MLANDTWDLTLGLKGQLSNIIKTTTSSYNFDKREIFASLHGPMLTL